MLARLETPPTNPLTPHLFVDPEDDRGVCHEFLTEAVSRFPEDDSVKDALVGAVEQMSSELSKLTMDGDYKRYVLVCALQATCGESRLNSGLRLYEILSGSLHSSTKWYTLPCSAHNLLVPERSKLRHFLDHTSQSLRCRPTSQSSISQAQRLEIQGTFSILSEHSA